MMTIDPQTSPALGICCDCSGPAAINQFGACGTCGSGSVVRPFSLAVRLGKVLPFVAPPPRETPPPPAAPRSRREVRIDKLWKVAPHDPNFLRGERWK